MLSNRTSELSMKQMKSILNRAKYFNLQQHLQSILSVYEAAIAQRSAWLSALNMDRFAMKVNLCTNFTLISVSQPYNFLARQDGAIYCVLTLQGMLLGQMIQRHHTIKLASITRSFYILIRPGRISFLMHDKTIFGNFRIKEYYTFDVKWKEALSARFRLFGPTNQLKLMSDPDERRRSLMEITDVFVIVDQQIQDMVLRGLQQAALRHLRQFNMIGKSSAEGCSVL